MSVYPLSSVETHAVNSNPRQNIMQLYPLWNHFIQVEVRPKLKAALKVLRISVQPWKIGVCFFGGGGGERDDI